MVGYWISFSIFMISIVFGIPYCSRKINITNKKFIAKVVLLWILYDLFYMSCFIDNLICKFVFGTLAVLLIFTNLAGAFTSTVGKNAYHKFGLLIDFIVGLGLTIYLIYIIPDSVLQNVFVVIVSAVYGGLITLVGVAWTFKKADKDRKDEELKRAEPLFTFNHLLENINTSKIKKLCVANDGDFKEKGRIVCIELENSEKSTITIVRIYHDNCWYTIGGNNVMLPNKTCTFMFYYISKCNIYLQVEDIYANSYYYSVDVINTSSLKKGLVHDTASNITRIDSNKIKDVLDKQ